MRPDRVRAAVLAALLSAPAPAAPILGVATHFAQGWPLSLLRDAKAVGAPEIRDDVSWARGEPRPGRLDYPAVTGYLRRACGDGFRTLLVVYPSHPGYDGGAAVVSSPAAQSAFGRFVAGLLDRLPAGCVSGIEVGNELNSIDAMQAPQAIGVYAATLATLRAAIRPAHPDVAIVGGSTNAIGTGYLIRLMDAGAFASVDALAVHPYRAVPETVDLELRRLQDAMARRRVPRPIWATEFGDYFADPALAPPHMVKMAMLMGAAGVDHADWYALRDEPQFANMGLYDAAGRAKPAADAFALLQRLTRGGAPRRIDAGDPRTFVFALAAGGYVLWGDPRPIEFQTFTGATDSRGRVIARPIASSDDPIVLAPGTRYTFGRSEVIADSLTEYGRSPWSYWARHPGEPPIPLTMTDARWTSSYTRPGLDPLYVGATTLVPAGEAAAPTSAVVRYTAPRVERVTIAACLTKKPGGDGVRVTVTAGGKRAFEAVVARRLVLPRLTFDLAAGTPLTFAFAAAGRWGEEDVGYRIRLLAPGSTMPAACVG